MATALVMPSSGIHKSSSAFGMGSAKARGGAPVTVERQTRELLIVIPSKGHEATELRLRGDCLQQGVCRDVGWWRGELKWAGALAGRPSAPTQLRRRARGISTVCPPVVSTGFMLVGASALSAMSSLDTPARRASAGEQPSQAVVFGGARCWPVPGLRLAVQEAGAARALGHA